jgi:phosphatidate cytidylyltransferase
VASRWSDLRLRIVSAAVLVPVALGALWLGGPAWSLLVIVAAAGLAVEWAALCGAALPAPAGLALLAVLLTSAVLAAIGQVMAALVAVALGLPVLWGAASIWGCRHRRLLAVGAAYLGPAAVALIWLRGDPGWGFAAVLFLVLLIWATDIGAYLVGRLVGGPKLALWISPGKTWSGAAGGLLAAMLVGYAAAMALSGHDSDGARFWQVAAVSACLSMIAQAGDLLESAIKRHVGVKDSGRLIPGHGGLLDRLDGFLAAGPAFALWAVAHGAGVEPWQ